MQEMFTSRSRVRDMVTAALLAAMIAGTAWINIQIGPVPFTLQTTFVLLAGLLLRPGWAAASMGIYLLLGAVGLPVFAGGQGGFQALLGPTGGFLLAFPVAAWVLSMVRSLADRAAWSGRVRLAADIAGVIAAEVVIYAVGVPWLMASLGMDISKALAVAMLPFLIPDAVKAIIALVVVSAVRRVRIQG